MSLILMITVMQHNYFVAKKLSKTSLLTKQEMATLHNCLEMVDDLHKAEEDFR